MTHPTPTGGEEEDRELSLRISRRMLKTLATLNVGKLPFDQAVAVLRQAYVDAAVEHLQRKQPDKRLTRSAVALLTGMDSRTVAQLLESRSESDGPPDEQIVQQSPNAQVLGSWASEERWADPDTGKPRDLLIYGSGDTFQALVKTSIGKSVSYSMVLETLLSHGNVRKVGDNKVRLIDRVFRSESDLAKLRQALRMVDGVSKNIINGQQVREPEQRWPRGVVWSQRVRPAELAALRKEILALLRDKHVYELGELIDQHADEHDGPNQTIAGLGWYYWEDEPD